jgi:hypothetical protein
LLNDLFGIQARGGCSCAGPYGHRLLGIDLNRSHAFQHEIAAGCEGIKPGWVRVNFAYFIDEAVAAYLIDAVRFVAREGDRFLTDYRFDPRSGLWRHRRMPKESPLHLTDISYAGLPRSGYAAHVASADVSILADYLAEARRLAEQRVRPGPEQSPTGLDADAEALRWFDLPAVCLT